jgi:hypothetical protein
VNNFWSRNFVIADFNGDGRPDVFIDNTGLEVGDVSTWPGEQNTLLLSAPDGELHDVSATNLPQVSDFSHGSSAADVDGDGDVDIWVNNLGANDVDPELSLTLIPNLSHQRRTTAPASFSRMCESTSIWMDSMI